MKNSSGASGLTALDHRPDDYDACVEDIAVTLMREHAGGSTVSGIGGGGGEEGAESSRAPARQGQPQPGKLPGGDVDEVQYRDRLFRAVNTPLPPDDVESKELFRQLVASLINSDPKRAIALMTANAPAPIVEPAKVSRAAAMLKMCISDALLPQFRNFKTPQEIVDEVFAWEVESRGQSVPLLKEKMNKLKMGLLESPSDYFYRAKGYVEELALAGIVSPEWDSVSQMISGITHDRFSYVRGSLADLPKDELRFADVMGRYYRAESDNMSYAQNHPHHPPYLRTSNPPPVPAYAGERVFPPAGGRAAGAAGRGRGRGRGSDRGSLKCTHCQRPGHLAASCWKLHPELAPSASHVRTPSAAAPPTRVEYDALLALILAQNQK